MKLGVQAKQPGEVISVSIHYDEALDPKDEVTKIVAAWVEPRGELWVLALLAGMDLASRRRGRKKDRVRLILSNGVSGRKYKVSTRVRTAGGEVLEDELFVKVKEV